MAIGSTKEYQQMELPDLPVKEAAKVLREAGEKKADSQIKIIIRWINKQNQFGPAGSGSEPAFNVEAYINQTWLSQGWKLHTVQFIGQNEEAFGWAFILVR